MIDTSTMTDVTGWPFTDAGALGAVETSPFFMIYTNEIFFADLNGVVYCLNNETGLKNWSYSVGSAVRTLVWYIYDFAASSGVAYFGSDDGYVYALDGATGALISNWPGATGGVVRKNFGILWGEDKIIVPSDSGKIYCFPAP
jgi:outer membrane protein assembly factor BamB